MVRIRSSPITTPWPMRKVPRIWAVKASGGTIARSATVEDRVHSRSKGKSSGLGWSCWATLHPSKVSVIRLVRFTRAPSFGASDRGWEELSGSAHALFSHARARLEGRLHGRQQDG